MLFKSYVVSSFKESFENKEAIDFLSVPKNCCSILFLIPFSCFFPALQCFLFFLSKAFHKEELINL